jgi:hypothetical protein
MLAHCSAARRDELLYSLLARLRLRLGMRHHRTLQRLLFGARNAKVRVDLPCHLDRASVQIPARILGAGRTIADKMTLLPFYSPFLQAKVLTRVEAAMTSSEHAHWVAAVTPMRVGYAGKLQFCPKCWQDDVSRGRERYWKRSHQAPGAFTCHDHGGALWQSAVETINKPSVQRLVSADEAYLLPSRKLDIRGLDRRILKYVAKGAHWLLNHNTERPGPSALRAAYIEALHERGLVRGERILTKEICRFVEEKVGTKLLSLWSSSFGNREHNWLTQILRASSCDRSSQAPLRHLILMAALGHDAESFFAALAAPRLSGREKMFTQLTRVAKKSACEQRKDEIVLWWRDEEVSVSEMARRIGVATDTVGLFAAKAGLPFPRKCKLGVIKPRLVRVRQPRTNLVDMRAAYCRALARYPLLSQTDISERTGGLVKWLHKNDTLWLEAHRPTPRRCGGNPGIDWKRRDQRCAELIPKILRRLQKRGHRISLSSIGRELRLNLPNVYARLPKTRDLCLSRLDSTLKISAHRPRQSDPVV